ncbi:hypothetical protein A2U01_0033102, partial [Trifolium medium]|nr:hypothetical protein [Trifolium medium]
MEPTAVGGVEVENNLDGVKAGDMEKGSHRTTRGRIYVLKVEDLDMEGDITIYIFL